MDISKLSFIIFGKHLVDVRDIFQDAYLSCIGFSSDIPQSSG